jgi:hypothetical protein
MAERDNARVLMQFSLANALHREKKTSVREAQQF